MEPSPEVDFELTIKQSGDLSGSILAIARYVG